VFVLATRVGTAFEEGLYGCGAAGAYGAMQRGHSAFVEGVRIGARIEQIWLVEVPYTPQAPELRPALRREHLARMMRLKVQDRIIEVGGTSDFAKSVILVRASSEDEIRELIAEDVYTTGGVWQAPVIVGYGRLVLGE